MMNGELKAQVARAKQVIFLFQFGGPSQFELFDPKAELHRRDGADLPPSILGQGPISGLSRNQVRLPVVAPRVRFARHGESGLPWHDAARRCAMSKLMAALAGLVPLAVGVPLGVTAQGGTAESGFPFEPVHAWPVGLGGAGVALGGSQFSLLNPAAPVGEHAAEISHRASPIGARDYAISVGFGGHWGTVQVAARRRDWGEIARDLGLNDLTAGEQSLSVSFARPIVSGKVRWGISLARLDANYVGARTGTWAFDGGAQATIGRGFTLGVAVLQAGRGFESDGGRAPLPTRIRPGAAWQGRLGNLQLTAAADLPFSVRFDSPPDVHTGVELRGAWGPVSAATRAGYRSLANRDGSGSRQGLWALGGGISMGPIAADIAYAFGAVFGDERFISLTVHW